MRHNSYDLNQFEHVIGFTKKKKKKSILKGRKTGSPKCVLAVSGEKKITQMKGNQDNLHVA